MYPLQYYLIGSIFAFLIWCFIKYAKWRNDVYKPIEKIKGPKSYFLIGTLYKFIGAKRFEMFQILTQITKEFQPFFRTWNVFTPEVHIMKPHHLEQIMTSTKHIKKSSRYRFVADWLGDGLLLSYGSKWHQRRKLITPTFHFKILESFMQVFEEQTKILLRHLDERCDEVGFDVYPYITHCALDIICETAMGVSVNAMTDRNSTYTKAIYDISLLVIERIFSLFHKNAILYPLTPSGRRLRQHLDTVHSFTTKVISHRRKTLEQKRHTETDTDKDIALGRKRISFLDLLLESPNLSDADIREEVDTFMFEGHDTTTAAMCWTLFLLANHPQIQEKVYEEVKSVLHEKRTPGSISELNEMPYLECCIKESLRLYPSVPVIGRTFMEKTIIDGYEIPKGTDLVIHVYDAHRDPETFPEPDKFDPDRFLSENTPKRHPYAYIPFSAGPRNCIGQKFAIYEEKTILSAIIKSYEILPVDTEETVKIAFELVLRPVWGLKIALKKRGY